MRKKLLTITLTLTLTLTVAAQTGRQLKVYIKGGLTDKVQVDGDASIGHSRTDLNGTVHDDFVSMVITDSEGRERQYLISQIDSLVMPNGRRVVFVGNVNGNDNVDVNVDGNGKGRMLRTSFDGDFPGTVGKNVTFFWTENDHIRLDVGDESRATNLTNDKKSASFIFQNTDLNAQSYFVYYPDRSVTIPSEQTQMGPDNTEHIGRSGDCGIALATQTSNSTYSFTLEHKVAYLCFLPHIDHLPSVKLTKIRLEASINYLTDAYPSGVFQLSENGLYSGKNYSRAITLNLKNTDGSDGFFIVHNLNTAKDECSAYMVVAPQGANVHYAVTYYLTDTLSRMTRTYVQRFAPGALVANTVYPVGCHIPDHLFRSIDLGLSKRWSSVNVGADVPSQDGMEYSTWDDAEAALLTDTKVTQWVKPTDEEKQELLTKCSWTRGSYNGSSGWFVTGAAAGLRDGQIHRLFIPAAANLTEAQSLEQHYRPVEALMVDLGLSDRSLWAVRNIGAGSADDYGEFYSWGELAQKSFYSYRDYAYYKSNGNTWINIGTNRDISGTEYDAAHMLWGGAWHIPSRAEWQVLMNECDWVWTTDFANGHNGYLITSRANGRKLFLPAAGNLRDAGSVPDNANVVAQYPTSERSTSYADYIWAMNCHYNWNSGAPYFGEGSGENHQYRAYGRVIRPVATGKFDVESLKLNINTSPSDWTFGDETATLRGTISSPLPLVSPLTVGFVVGDSVNIDIDHCANNYEQQVSLLGSFEHELSVFANLGQWYKAYVKVGDEYYYGQPRHYAAEMVDLGLPSKTLWANINVGANREGDFGNYYAWGETETKDSYTEANYKWRVNGNYLHISENISGTKYDAALVVMGPLWQMPTKAQYEELLNEEYVTRELVDYQSSACWKFTSKKDSTKFIYLPYGGQMIGSTWSNTDYGVYLMGDVFTSDIAYHWHLQMPPSTLPNTVNVNQKYKGQLLRAVARAKSDETGKRIVEVTTEEADWTPTPGASKATLNGSFVSNMPLDGPAKVGFVVGDSAAIDTAHCRLKTAPQTLTREGSFASEVDIYDNLGYWYRAYVAIGDTVYYGDAQQYGMVMVDLGLPSKTLWANMNVGARTPLETGNFYAWGETTTKDIYSSSNYAYHRNGQYVYLELDISGTQYDAAMANLGTLWVTPTREQQQELKSNCTWSRVLIDGQWCCKGQSKVNGNYIILPEAGYVSDAKFGIEWNSQGYYQSSTHFEPDLAWFWRYHIGSNGGDADNVSLKYQGFPVRAVANHKNGMSDGFIINVTTDSVDWTLSQPQATLYGRCFSSVPLGERLSVGFILGDSVNIDKDCCSIVLPATLQSDGSFAATQAVFDNRGYWYRAFAVVDGHYYYGDVSQYGQIMVDLGLPTGTLWASMNVGAGSAIESGSFFAWGETTTKDTYSVANYTYHVNNSYVNIGSNIQGTQYDAAMANMGPLWLTPTREQQQELKANCTWSRVLIDGQWCCKGQSKVNGNYIILPEAGYVSDANFGIEWNSQGYYQSSTHFEPDLAWFWRYHIGSNGGDADNVSLKYQGFPVRAIANKNNQTVGGQTINVTTHDNNSWVWNDTQVVLRGSLRTREPFTGTATVGFVVGDSANLDHATMLGDSVVGPVSDTCTFTKTVTVENHEGRYYRAYVKIGGLYYYGEVRQYGLVAVDLGLPSKTKWANMNLGAARPEEPGGYFAWGERATKSEYTTDTYMYKGQELPTDISGNVNYDAATYNLGSGWKMPTKEQFEELYNTTYCDRAFVMVNGLYCYRLTSKTNGRMLYIPMGGAINGATPHNDSWWAFYWTATRSSNTTNAWRTNFYGQSSYGMVEDARWVGLNIRPVRAN